MSAQPPSFDDRQFKQALGRFPTGVTIITTRDGEGMPVGLTVSSFNSVSLAPPLVVWSLKRSSHSLGVFEQCERYVIQVLAFDQLGLAKRFATGTPADRFHGQTLVDCPNGSPRLDVPSAAWFECYNRHHYDEGDHIVLIGEVENCAHADRAPLIYHGGGYDLTPSV
ncbi:MAG: flavin reductase family protein [Burkholderiaceae bacterium]|nr:flavin reductase family protein [Burkholderiaceae bacterium]MCD8516589.1 flavin reductase family protein [Burkholderiaceae bacterium]MCD8537303.1 flavin reductase family protein [Burkholderiaceae bacterium]MCD8565187.1 flavin reductase family protein [Burkholderiaceae bacterium]